MRAQKLFWKTASVILDEIAVEPMGYINLCFLHVSQWLNSYTFFNNVDYHAKKNVRYEMYGMQQPCLLFSLNHWGRVTHIWVNNLSIIGSDNGLLLGPYQALIQTNTGILLIEHLRTNFSEILIEIHTFSFKNKQFKMSSAKWRPFCLGLIALTLQVFVPYVPYVYKCELSFYCACKCTNT